ncbi:MAG: GGDEF domain-containing protein [Myxococcales bacterium]|nr:GGDEF domain-containing protein [Myxococcales bacterium]
MIEAQLIDKLVTLARAPSPGEARTALIDAEASLGEHRHLFAPLLITLAARAEELQRLERQAVLDPLTEIANRRGLQQALDREISRSARGGEPLSLLLLDLDGLKTLNDRFGHKAGDEAICAVGAAIVASLRAGDTAARLGGDEFAVVLPATDAEGASAVAERIRARVEASTVGEIALGVSIGLVTCDRDCLDAEHMFKAADAGLYADKRARKEISSSLAA